jgi:short subunit dehydrogenase-like uncharacterized protein
MIPWGDVATAWRSTGIPDIEVYMAANPALRLFSRASRRLGRLLASRPVQSILRQQVTTGPKGPTEEERRRGRAYVWGEVEDESGQRRVSRLVTPEAYTFTARAALAAVERVLEGAFRPGFQTPSLVLGADFVLEIEGTTRHDDAG